MDILVVGSGGREHAIILKLREDPKVGKIYAAPGNGGISAYAECLNIKANDAQAIIKAAKELKVSTVFVSMDEQLVAGMVDELNKAGIKTFGPSRAAAQLEGSKVFSKGLMKKYGIPTADYESFDSVHKAMEYIINKNAFPTVIKADGLAAGKGVIIAHNPGEAKSALDDIMEDKKFGASGDHVVVEEFLTGPEVSVLAFTDGKTVKPMVSSMDHKTVFDGGVGPNTGGMGTIAPNPFYTAEIAEKCMKSIFVPTIEAMRKEGKPFKGCLYFGLMLTPKGPYVIEYNCRFGDPEAQVVLPLLETSLADIIAAIDEERLDNLPIKWKNGAATCVIMASGGYPVKYQTGYEIKGLNANGQLDGAIIYHAGTVKKDGGYFTSGGRVLGVTAVGENLEDARGKSYEAVKKIDFKDRHYRLDIGSSRL